MAARFTVRWQVSQADAKTFQSQVVGLAALLSQTVGRVRSKSSDRQGPHWGHLLVSIVTPMELNVTYELALELQCETFETLGALLDDPEVRAVLGRIQELSAGTPTAKAVEGPALQSVEEYLV